MIDGSQHMDMLDFGTFGEKSKVGHLHKQRSKPASEWLIAPNLLARGVPTLSRTGCVFTSQQSSNERGRPPQPLLSDHLY